MRSRTVQVTAPIVQERRPVGRVVVLGQLEGEAGRVAQSLIISLLAAAIAAIAGLLVAWRLQRGISGPIQALTGAVNAIRETHDYARRADVRADDEVAELVTGFNGMLDEIRLRDDEIARHVDGLEQTVAERTADLVVAKEAAEAATNDVVRLPGHREPRDPHTDEHRHECMAEDAGRRRSAAPPAPLRRGHRQVGHPSFGQCINLDILDFVLQIEAGKLELESAPVDAADVAEDVCSLFWERARATGLDLAAYIDPATPRLIASDEVRLRQIVGNLVNNAIKFTETGGVLVQIRAARRNRRLRLAVQDTGIGIAPEKLGSVFGAFTQADQSTTRKFGGTGLGLTICKRLVEAMGGEIGVKSQVGRGSIFAVEVPVTVLEPADPWPRLEGTHAALVLAGLPTRHALGRYLASAGPEGVVAGGRGGLKTGGLDRRRSRRTLIAQRTAGIETICIGEYGDSAPEALRRSGAVDAVLVQPFRFSPRPEGPVGPAGGRRAAARRSTRDRGRQRHPAPIRRRPRAGRRRQRGQPRGRHGGPLAAGRRRERGR